MGTFVLAGIVLTGAWTQLDVIGWPVWLLPIVTLALDADRFHLHWPVNRRRPASEGAIAVVIAASLCAVHVLHIAMTAREEFGFGGDEGYHLSAVRAFAIYFMKAGPYLAAAGVVFGACRYWAPRYASTIALVFLIAASFMLPPEPLFGRYPAAFYLLAAPLNIAFDVARIPYPFTANHVMNVLSLPAWLFALRPVILGRWPDWRVLPVALLIYMLGSAFVYVGSSLLEPWAFVFVLLSMEAVVVLDRDRTWVAVFLAAIATFFKDTAILFLPVIWLLAMVDWHRWQPRLRTHAISVGAAAVVPFVTYYAVRRGLHIFRGYDVAGAGDVWTISRAWDWLSVAHQQLGLGGAVAVGVATAWCFLGFRIDRRRHEHVVWSLAAIALVIFFAADVASIPYTGYGRFLAYPLLAVCGVVFTTTHAVGLHRRRLLTGVSCALILVLLPAASRMLALDFRPDYERNSLEWSQGLVRLPIRSLAKRLPDLDEASIVTKIRVIAFELDPISVRVAYPGLAERYELHGEMQSSLAPDCACRVASEAVLAGFEWPVHFSATPQGRERYQQQQSRCVAQVRATCTAIALEQHPGGSIAGVLGVGAR
jgi:hypothetical protein